MQKNYETLTNIVNDIPKHHVIIECGDFNAHLGTDAVRHTFHEQTNSNGKLLLEHASECSMHITNTMFEKKKGKLWTYVSDMSGTKSQIDYILINKKWKNSVHDCEAYNSFSSMGSDHRLVTAKIRLSLRTSKSPALKKKYDWSVLRNTTHLQELYTITVRNRYAGLCCENDNVTEQYGKFVQANAEAAEKLIPVKKKTKRKKHAEERKVVEARAAVENAFITYQKDPSTETQHHLQEKKVKLKKAYEEIEEEELNDMITEVENADSRSKHGESWQLINKITGRKTAKRGIIKGNSKEDRINKWFEHFHNLLGKEPEISGVVGEEDLAKVLNDLQIEDGIFTSEELQSAKKSLCEGKASGPDNIPPEVLKRCDLDDIILEYANKLLIENMKPDQWSEIDLLPIPKSGDLGETINYRGISLSSLVTKVVNKMILYRIQPKIDKHLRPNQNGFRPGRSTTAHILALRRLIEGVKSHNKKAIILFVDFRKAFDSIHREMMMKILKAYDIPPNLLRTISKLYEDTRVRVITPDGETEFFKIIAGVLQGDTLAPYLFAIVLDYVLRNTFSGREEELGFKLQKRKSRRVPPVVVTDLDFADDLALLSEEIEQAQEVLKRLEEEACKVGLHCNAKKTEIQAFNQETPVIVKAKDGTTLKVVQNFKYLGAWTESTEKDLSVRKALAWSACHKLRKIWTSGLSANIKVRLFVATVESVLLYGAETWTLTKALKKQLDGCYTRMLRMALNVSWKSHLTNDQVYKDLPRVSVKVQQRRMRLAGHCIRHSDEEANKLVLWQPTDGKPSRGRRRITYLDNLLEDTGMDNAPELRSIMENRECWRKCVKDVGRPDGRPR